MRHSEVGCILISNSDDLRFLYAGLVQLAPVIGPIVVAIGTKLWNGEAEDEGAIKAFIERVSGQEALKNVHFLRYNVPDDAINSIKWSVSPEMYWEGHARWVAYQKLASLVPVVEYILLLDSDEIVDGSAFEAWLDTGIHQGYTAMKLRNYWYWREPTLRAIGYYEDSAVLVKNGSFNTLSLFSNMGRHGAYERSNGTKRRDVRSKDDDPMIHHYSWVRTKEQMLRKVRAWGHRNDKKNWEYLVEEEFNRPFNGTDFLKGLAYESVDDSFGLA